MGSGEQTNAVLVTAKTFSSQIQLKLVSCCPTMDLVALATAEQRVEVYRFGGQRAFQVQRKEQGILVESLCWKYNGQYLAVSWSDRLVDVVSTETGAILQNFRQVTSPERETGPEKIIPRLGSVNCLGWGLSLVDPYPNKTTKKRLNTKPPKIDYDAFLDREPNLDALGFALDLPDQLASFDATELMPKLPVLPVFQTSGRPGKHPNAEIFASQASIDAVLHKGVSQELHAVNTFLLTEPEGSLRVILYDALGIGNVSLGSISPVAKVRYLRHNSHPMAHCHTLLAEISLPGNSTQLALVPLAMRFLRFAGKNVHFIDFKTSQLEMLVLYVGECLQSIHHHWRHSRDLPSRFQQNIEETLQENKEPNLVQSLSQLAAMGYCTPAMKEWITDELGDRGQKRWDHSITQGYTKVLELLQENLMPALDRCSVILSSLQGLAEYHEHSPAFDVSISSFVIIIDIIKCIRLICHHLVIWAGEEFQRFNAFSTWLKHIMGVLKADPASQAGEDLYEDDPNIEYHFVLAYIGGALQKSKLDKFLGSMTDAPSLKASKNLYEETKKALDDFKQARVYTKPELLNLPSYYLVWGQHNRTLIEHITAWQRSNTVMPGGFVLTNGSNRLVDLRMVSDFVDDSIFSFVLSVTDNESSRLNLFRLRHTRLFDEIPKSIQACDAIAIEFGDTQILDARFLDDDTLLLLLRNDVDSIYFIMIPYRSPNPNFNFEYESVEGQVKNMNLLKGACPKITSVVDLSDLAALSEFIRYHFDSKEDSFRPAKIEVTGRKSRRVCVLVGDDGKQMRIYDVDGTGAATEKTTDSDVEMNG